MGGGLAEMMDWPLICDPPGSKRLHTGKLDSARSDSRYVFIERLHADADGIRRLSEFLLRYGKLFRGRESLGFDEALELIDRLEALKRLEDRLTSRDFDSIDLDEIAGLLGEDAAAEIERLGEMITALVEAGYLRPLGDHMVISPKGARRTTIRSCSTRNQRPTWM